MSRLATLLEHRYDTLVPGPADHVAPLHEHLRAALQTLVAALRSDPRPIDVPAPGDLDPDQLLRAHAELRRHILDLVDAEDLALTPAELRAFSEFTTDAITDATTRRARHPQGEPLPASETRLQLVTDALPILVSFVTADERYALVNRAYEHWFGLPREQLLGRTLLEVIGEAAYAALQPYVRRGLAGERFSFEQYQVPYRLGGTRDVRVTFVPHRDPADVVDGYIAFLEDISEQRRLDQAHHLLAGQRQRQAEFEQQLIGIVSHDLRNPLTVIQLAATVVSRREHLSERASADIQRILKAVDRATRLVRDLLDFTKARLGGGIAIDPRPTDLHALVRGVKDETELAFPDRRVELRQEGDTHGDWDPDRIVQIVENLLTNALKYSPADTTVQLLTRADATTVSLHVHNAGPAITAPQLHRLFEPLQRAAEHDDRTTRSVGLGLYIVKQLVEAHRGAITVDSSEVDGTTVTVTLPRHCRVA